MLYICCSYNFQCAYIVACNCNSYSSISIAYMVYTNVDANVCTYTPREVYMLTTYGIIIFNVVNFIYTKLSSSLLVT